MAAIRPFVGRTVDSTSSTYTIVGVMPRDFYFPDRTADLWVPLTLGPAWYADRENNFLRVLGRLKPGASLETARTEMDGVMVALEKAHPQRERAVTSDGQAAGRPGELSSRGC